MDSQTTFASAPTPPSSDQGTGMEGVEGPPPVSEKADTEMKDGESEQDQSQVESSTTPPDEAAPSPPDRPPPVPPRPAAAQVDKAQLIQEEVELGAQQDVTEVINNVLFQAQCAIKPLRYDADGEPVDLITE
jgi:ubiquitin carboxyl-terminal hydrolase 25/28